MINPTVNIIVNIIFGFLIGFSSQIILATTYMRNIKRPHELKKLPEEPRRPTEKNSENPLLYVIWLLFIIIMVFVYIYSPLKFRWLFFFGSLFVGTSIVMGFFQLAIKGKIRIKKEKFFDIQLPDKINK